MLNISAASIVSTVGSLKVTNIRYAAQSEGQSFTGHFEIVSLVGNIDLQDASADGSKGSGHVHISVSDGSGATLGGHLLEGNVVYTTAEITLLELPSARFYRDLDNAPGGSGYYELKIARI